MPSKLLRRVDADCRAANITRSTFYRVALRWYLNKCKPLAVS